MSRSSKPQPAYKLVNSSKLYSWNGHPVELSVRVNGLNFHTVPGEPLYVDFLLGDVQHRLFAERDETGDNNNVLGIAQDIEGDDFWTVVDGIEIPVGHEILHFLFADGKSLAEHSL
jgi:hypothetical protein